MSILIVDDNATLLSKIVRSLTRANRSARGASSLAQARQLMMEKQPSVLCLDLQLGDGNGFDLLREIRQSGSKLPVVVISGYRSVESTRRAEQLGAAVFLTKPFALSELHEWVVKLLDARPNDRGAQASEPNDPDTASNRN
ncbi:MAG TPA: response regulator [Gammaproteobacteria bacterium]|nr:response regulator [Gammaproteobacteria bacterium]